MRLTSWAIRRWRIRVFTSARVWRRGRVIVLAATVADVGRLCLWWVRVRVEGKKVYSVPKMGGESEV